MPNITLIYNNLKKEIDFKPSNYAELKNAFYKKFNIIPLNNFIFCYKVYIKEEKELFQKQINEIINGDNKEIEMKLYLNNKSPIFTHESVVSIYPDNNEKKFNIESNESIKNIINYNPYVIDKLIFYK